MRKALIRRLMIYLSIILICYIALVTWIALNQESLVYFPRRELPITPADRGLAYQDVWMATSDGITIHGWFMPAPAARGTLLFFHGNGDTVSSASAVASFFQRLGLHCFFVDYRGYGWSEGQPSEAGTYRDAEAAWRYLVETRQTPPTEIILLGHSLGGGVAAWLAEQHPPAGLILQETFTSLPDVGAIHYPFLPVRLFARNRYPTLERLPHIHVPLLVIHSRDDPLIPFSQGQQLYMAANDPKTFLELRGGHGTAANTSRPEYAQTVSAFIRSVLASP